MATKQKEVSVRTYDQDGYRRRAACVCIRDHSQKEVLLVSTNHDPDLWIVPGGGVEPTERVEEAAVREVLEEAGVKGTIAACLGLFESTECKHRTMVYLMVVQELLNEWQEALSIGRKRRWFTIEEAKIHLGQHRPSHRLYLDILHSSHPANPLPTSSGLPNANNCNNDGGCGEGNEGDGGGVVNGEIQEAANDAVVNGGISTISTTTSTNNTIYNNSNNKNESNNDVVSTSTSSLHNTALSSTTITAINTAANKGVSGEVMV